MLSLTYLTGERKDMRVNNRRAQIIAEATVLFSKHGFQGSSIRGIAQRCGISEAAIYRHFDSKVGMYEAVLQEKASEHDITEYLEAHSSAGGIEDVLRGIAFHILDFREKDPELLGLMFNNSVESGPVAAVLFKEIRLPYIRFLSAQLKRRIEAGEVRQVDPNITARCFVGMVMDCALSVGVWNKVSKFHFVASDVVANNVPIFARGLMSDEELAKARH